MIARNSQNLGQLLRRLRKKKGLSQAALAKKSGLRQPSISDIEKGGNAGTESIFKILAALDAEISLSPIDRQKNIFEFEE